MINLKFCNGLLPFGANEPIGKGLGAAVIQVREILLIECDYTVLIK